MRILWASNAPWAGTGYGMQTALVCESLRDAGHDVAIASNYGWHGSMTNWRGIKVYPHGYDVYSNDVIPSFAEDWFAGEPGWCVLLYDAWVMRNPKFQQTNTAVWCPVDHMPTPPNVVRFFKEMGAVPIAMSRFGETQLRKAGLDPLYVPHGVDTEVFTPGDRAESRDVLKTPADAFVVAVNAANKGRMPIRKAFDRMLQAFGVFARERSDAVLYLHTDMGGQADGVNLWAMCEHYGIPEGQVFYTDQVAYRKGLSPEGVAHIYRAADVLLMTSRGEGFGIPAIEAQACGTPVIVSNFSAQPELVGDGWVVNGNLDFDANQGADLFAPDPAEIHSALVDAYDNATSTPSETARAKALEYDHRHLFETMWTPILANLRDRLPSAAPIFASSIKAAM